MFTSYVSLYGIRMHSHTHLFLFIHSHARYLACSQKSFPFADGTEQISCLKGRGTQSNDSYRPHPARKGGADICSLKRRLWQGIIHTRVRNFVIPFFSSFGAVLEVGDRVPHFAIGHRMALRKIAARRWVFVLVFGKPGNGRDPLGSYTAG